MAGGDIIAWLTHSGAVEKLLKKATNHEGIDPVALERELSFALFLAHEHRRHADDLAKIEADIHAFCDHAGIPVYDLMKLGGNMGRFNVGAFMETAKVD